MTTTTLSDTCQDSEGNDYPVKIDVTYEVIEKFFARDETLVIDFEIKEGIEKLHRDEFMEIMRNNFGIVEFQCGISASAENNWYFRKQA